MRMKKVLAALQTAHRRLMEVYWTLHLARRLVTVVISIILTLQAIQTDLLTAGGYASVML